MVLAVAIQGVVHRIGDIGKATNLSYIWIMKTFIEALTESKPKYAHRLVELYTQATGEIPRWDNMTKANLYALTRHLQEVLAQNSAKTYANMVKAVMGAYSDQITFPEGYEKILRIKGEATASTWLTDCDIESLIDYYPSGMNETRRLVKNQFILGCLTGARWSDYSDFTERNIINGNLVYVSKKTGIRSEIPCSPAVERILREENVSGSVSTMHFNRTIRDLCQNAGINDAVKVFHGGQMLEGEKWQFVSSHTARRSFATNVYLRCRDIFMVSRYMGHSSVDMTAKYILSIGDAPQEIKDYFEQFK